MIRIRTNRNTWRDVYLSSSDRRLRQFEPKQSNPAYVDDGVAVCRLAVRQVENEREQSIWLMLDVAAMGSATASQILGRFLEEDTQELAKRAVGISRDVVIKSQRDLEAHANEADTAEAELAAIAKRVELPALVRIDDRAARAWSRNAALLMTLLGLNVAMLALIVILFVRGTSAVPSPTAAVTLSDEAVNAIAARTKADTATELGKLDALIAGKMGDTLKDALSDKTTSDALKAAIVEAVQNSRKDASLDYNRLKNQKEILTAIEALHRQPDGYKGGDEQLAEHLAAELKKR